MLSRGWNAQMSSMAATFEDYTPDARRADDWVNESCCPLDWDEQSDGVPNDWVHWVSLGREVVHESNEHPTSQIPCVEEHRAAWSEAARSATLSTAASLRETASTTSWFGVVYPCTRATTAAHVAATTASDFMALCSEPVIPRLRSAAQRNLSCL